MSSYQRYGSIDPYKCIYRYEACLLVVVSDRGPGHCGRVCLRAEGRLACPPFILLCPSVSCILLQYILITYDHSGVSYSFKSAILVAFVVLLWYRHFSEGAHVQPARANTSQHHIRRRCTATCTRCLWLSKIALNTRRQV